jgi:hypothetical protein
VAQELDPLEFPLDLVLEGLASLVLDLAGDPFGRLWVWADRILAGLDLVFGLEGLMNHGRKTSARLNLALEPATSCGQKMTNRHFLTQIDRALK